MNNRVNMDRLELPTSGLLPGALPLSYIFHYESHVEVFTLTKYINLVS